MDTWIVGKKPLAVHQAPLSESAKKSLGGEEVRFVFTLAMMC